MLISLLLFARVRDEVAVMGVMVFFIMLALLGQRWWCPKLLCAHLKVIVCFFVVFILLFLLVFHVQPGV